MNNENEPATTLQQKHLTLLHELAEKATDALDHGERNLLLTQHAMLIYDMKQCKRYDFYEDDETRETE